MKLTATIDGAELAQRALALLEPAVHDRVSGVVQEDAVLVAEKARARVHRRSGELASTIRTTSSRDGLVAWVQAGYGTLKRRGAKKTGADNDEPGVYAMVEEFGDARRNHAAHPYMIPSAEEVRPAHQRKLEAALEDAVDGVGGAT